jgi:hypothetical protein
MGERCRLAMHGSQLPPAAGRWRSSPSGFWSAAPWTMIRGRHRQPRRKLAKGRLGHSESQRRAATWQAAARCGWPCETSGGSWRSARRAAGEAEGRGEPGLRSVAGAAASWSVGRGAPRLEPGLPSRLRRLRPGGALQPRAAGRNVVGRIVERARLLRPRRRLPPSCRPRLRLRPTAAAAAATGTRMMTTTTRTTTSPGAPRDAAAPDRRRRSS